MLPLPGPALNINSVTWGWTAPIFFTTCLRGEHATVFLRHLREVTEGPSKSLVTQSPGDLDFSVPQFPHPWHRDDGIHTSQGCGEEKVILEPHPKHQPDTAPESWKLHVPAAARSLEPLSGTEFHLSHLGMKSKSRSGSGLCTQG